MTTEKPKDRQFKEVEELIRKALSEKDKEMEQLVSSIKEMHHNSKIVGNLIAEKDKDIERLNRIWEDGVVLLKWKDKEIEQLKQEIVELQHRLVHSDEELTGNSRDFWKAEATKLKSEKARIPFEKRSSNPKNGSEAETIRELNDFGAGIIEGQESLRSELIKAVEKFKVIDGLDVIINKGDIVIFKKEWELLKGDKK